MTTATPRKKIVRDLIDPEKLMGDVKIDGDLNGSMMEQASLFVHYGVLQANALRQVHDIELLLEVKKSQVAKAMRDALVAQEKKPVEAAITKDVELHPDVVHLTRALNEAKLILDLGKVGVEAFKQRRDMLVQLGANGREERKGEVRTMGVKSMAQRVIAARADADAAAEPTRQPE